MAEPKKANVGYLPADLDAMSAEELSIFIASGGPLWDWRRCGCGRYDAFQASKNRHNCGRRREVRRLLLMLAQNRLDRLRAPKRKANGKWARHYGQLYERLPAWARWRKPEPLQAQAVSGKAIRIRPRRIVFDLDAIKERK